VSIPLNWLNEPARTVLGLAQDEAVGFHHDYIGPEHLLLGLLREGRSAAAQVLSSLGAEYYKAHAAVERINGRGRPEVILAEIALLPESKRVIELAHGEAGGSGDNRIAPEHLLLGIVREPGRADAVFKGFGVSRDAIREKLTETLGS
jgi:ATP-dependent Clp protease ATP-binding subunit ClpC